MLLTQRAGWRRARQGRQKKEKKTAQFPRQMSRLLLPTDGILFCVGRPLFSSSFDSHNYLLLFLIYNTYRHGGGRGLKKAEKDNRGYFNDVMDEPEPIYMMVGREGKEEETYWNLAAGAG